MEIDYANIIDSAFPQPPAPVYLLVGSDDAVKREAVDRLVAPMLDPSSSDFDREDIDIGMSESLDGSWSGRILSSAGGMPMFSERRVVIVGNIQRLSKEEQEALAAGVGKLCERTCLVLVAVAPEYDGGRVKARTTVNAKLQSAVAKAGVVVTCDVPSAGDLKARAAAYLRAVGKSAEPAALEIIVQRAVAAAADRG